MKCLHIATSEAEVEHVDCGYVCAEADGEVRRLHVTTEPADAVKGLNAGEGVVGYAQSSSDDELAAGHRSLQLAKVGSQELHNDVLEADAATGSDEAWEADALRLLRQLRQHQGIELQDGSIVAVNGTD